MSMIHFVGGEKGGVGKSVMARVLSQYCLDTNRPYLGLDADQSHPTLTRFYPDFTHPLNLDFFETADEIIELALAENRHLVVDLPAQSQRFLDRWVAENDVLALCEELQITLTYWYVVDDSHDSVHLLEQFLNQYQTDLQCIIVKNKGRGQGFNELDRLLALNSASNAPLQMCLAPLHDSTMRKIDKLNFSFWSAINVKEGETPYLTLMERQRVNVWLKKCYATFDELWSQFG
jgi:hypothetical protein